MIKLLFGAKLICLLVPVVVGIIFSFVVPGRKSPFVVVMFAMVSRLFPCISWTIMRMLGIRVGLICAVPQVS